MKKKLHTILTLSVVLLASMLFSSCEGDKTYVEDPSANWKIFEFPVDANGGGNKGKWVWDNNKQCFKCEFIINDNDLSVDEYIYNKGVALGYVFIGTQNVNEVQTILPFYDDVLDGNLWFETAIQGSQKDFVVRFFYQGPNGNASPLPFYNLRLVLIW